MIVYSCPGFVPGDYTEPVPKVQPVRLEGSAGRTICHSPSFVG